LKETVSLRLFIALVLLTASLMAIPVLQQNYGYSDHTVTANDLFPELETDFILFEIPSHKTRYRVASSEIVKAFAKHGIALNDAKIRYVNFTKRSPVEIEPLYDELAEYYTLHYPSISIHDITIMPRVYTPQLPEGYNIVISDNSYKSAKGTFYAATETGKKYFFDYIVDGDVKVYVARNDLKRKTEINGVSVKTAAVPLHSLKSQPFIQQQQRYRLKRNVKADEVIRSNYVEPAPLVLRDNKVSASIKTGNVIIHFHAIALQDGAFHDIISIQKPDGKRIKAKVVGDNKVEIE
jgi:flagella basal body P-ring formation protein FlgA